MKYALTRNKVAKIPAINPERFPPIVPAMATQMIMMKKGAGIEIPIALKISTNRIETTVGRTQAKSIIEADFRISNRFQTIRNVPVQ
jgi:hypothetical protein